MDKYDAAIAYLVEHPDEVHTAWSLPFRHRHGCLFAECTPSGQFEILDNGEMCGCLTQIKGIPDEYFAWTSELTAAIVADDRIPDDPENIVPTIEGLTPFAEWQRKMDAMWPERTANA